MSGVVMSGVVVSGVVEVVGGFGDDPDDRGLAHRSGGQVAEPT